MAQPVKCLPYKPKGLSSIPVTPIKKLNMVECVCNPNAGVGVVTDPWDSVTSQQGLIIRLQANKT